MGRRRSARVSINPCEANQPFRQEYIAARYELNTDLLKEFAKWNEYEAAEIFINRRKHIHNLKEGVGYNMDGRNVERFNPQFMRYNMKPDSWLARKMADGHKLPSQIQLQDRSV